MAINPGNSGGPLFNLNGEVVGINSMIYSGTGGYMGLSFAIPVDLAESVVKQLRDDGHVSRGWLGVLLQEVDRELAEVFGLDKPKGAVIRKVFPGSPAEKGGLEAGDVIISYDGKAVADVDALPPMVGATPKNSTVNIVVNRNGDNKTLRVTISELDDDNVNDINSGGRSSPKLPKLGLQVVELSEAERKELELSDGGVKVSDISHGPAQDAGIRKGDVILKLNGQLITSAAEMRKQVRDLAPGKLIKVYVIRRGTPLFVAMRIPKEDNE